MAFDHSPFVLTPAQALHALDKIGGKARSLAVLTDAGLPVPNWLVLTADTFWHCLTLDQQHALDAWPKNPDPQVLVGILSTIQMDPSVLTAVAMQLNEWDDWDTHALLAVRSSALDEDGESLSFAGMFSSKIGVPRSHVSHAILNVWLSGFSPRVMAYRAQNGVLESSHPKHWAPAVIVQRMIHAHASGVAFGADPLTGNREHCVISATYGLGTSLVSGQCNADTYVINTQCKIVQRDIVEKTTAHTFMNNQFAEVPIEASTAHLPVMNDIQVEAVANLTRYCGLLFGNVPQDIEWTADSQGLYVVQSRPITTGGPKDDVIHWSNSTLSESWGGFVLPLSFSLARNFYSRSVMIYTQCLSGNTQEIEGAEELSRRTVGLINGQLFWNHTANGVLWQRAAYFTRLDIRLGHWLKDSASSGSSNNSPSKSDGELDTEHPPSPVDSTLDWCQLTLAQQWQEFMQCSLSAIHLFKVYHTLESGKQRLYEKLNAQIEAVPKQLSKLSLTQLARLYEQCEALLCHEWETPMVQEYYASQSVAILDKLLACWVNPTRAEQQLPPLLALDMISGNPDMLTAKMALEQRHLAMHIALEPQASTIVDILCNGDTPAVDAMLSQHGDLCDRMYRYLNQYGDRCVEDCKMESPTLLEAPMSWLRYMGELARKEMQKPCMIPGASDTTPAYRQAENAVMEALATQPLKRWVMRFLIGQARELTAQREGYHFGMTRLIARIRWIALELGHHLTLNGQLDDAHDVFYLESQELLGSVRANTCCARLGELVKIRKAEYDSYRAHGLLPNSFETVGLPQAGQWFQQMAPQASAEMVEGHQRKGKIGFAGVVEGRVRVLHTDADRMAIEPGEIVVAPYGDPGMVSLFGTVAGLVFENGSILSHVVIVAREMGLPTLLQVAGATQWLKTGDWVTLDSRTGVITKAEKVTADAE